MIIINTKTVKTITYIYLVIVIINRKTRFIPFEKIKPISTYSMFSAFTFEKLLYTFIKHLDVFCFKYYIIFITYTHHRLYENMRYYHIIMKYAVTFQGIETRR